MENRGILFEKIQNARDLGGMKTMDGRMIRPGLLIRSAHLSDASPADTKKLAEGYRLAKIIDLRTDVEKQEKPDAAVDGAQYCPIPIFDEGVAGISHEKNQRMSSIPKMEDLYRMVVTDKKCRQNLGKAARAVMEHDFESGSVLWHCTAGKDRCGMLTVVLLSALGVDRAQIRSDYLLTNLVSGPKAEGYYQRMFAAGKTEQEAAAIRDVFLAKERYLDAALAAIDGQEHFLTAGLGIPAETIENFREKVLA